MLAHLLKILVAVHSSRRFLSFCSVIISLSLGICIFLTLECVLGNYKSSLIKKLLSAQPDVVIIKNPKFAGNEEELEELFPDEIEERTRLALDDVPKLTTIVKNISSNEFYFAPIVLKDEFVVSDLSKDGVIEKKTRFIAVDIAQNNRVFQVLDQLTEKQIEEFHSESTEVPIIISEDIYPGANVGLVLSLDFEGVKQKCKIVGVLEQNRLFPVSMVIVPSRFRGVILSDEKFTSLAIRCIGKTSPTKAKTLLEDALGERYLIRCWVDSIPVLDSVFNTINIFISAIICSLFILAFVFGISSFDILIRHYKSQLALLLSLGLPPTAIRNALLIISSLISILSLIIGIGLAVILLMILPATPIKYFMDIMYIDDLSFTFSPFVLLVTVLMSFVVTVGASFVSSKRVYKIDPIEDLRQ